MGLRSFLRGTLQGTLNALFAVGQSDEQIVGVVKMDYKAPHALRGTAQKRRRRYSSVLAPRLFKGHRP